MSSESKLIVVAIGGNSLIEDPAHVTVEAQFEAAQKTGAHIVKLVEQGHRVVIVHGNGPQVGYILRRAEFSRKILHPVPLDCCVADTQGAIGYNLQMGLYNEFKKAGFQKAVTTVISQVLVDPDDPSFNKPSKPIGSFMTKEAAEEFVESDGWSVMEDAGRGYRRVVPSPRPVRIIEMETIRSLVESDILVIAGGGGGIPVVEDSEGLHPREAVIDKDHAAALLAKELNADLLVISTAVEKVFTDFGKETQKGLEQVNTDELKIYSEEGQFAPGSMLPKIQAMINFVESTGKSGIITDPEHLPSALEGRAGTHIRK